MTILFTAISRGSLVLARYAKLPGNFTEVTAQILNKISPLDKKLTYSHGPYLFHYICEKRIIYLCITDNKFESFQAFIYLEQIKNKFLAIYKLRVDCAQAYEMNDEFSRVLAYEMERFNNRIVPAKVDGNVNELREIIIKNTDEIAMREQFELFIKKTGKTIHPVPSHNPVKSFFSSKITFFVIIILLIVLILLFFISSVYCFQEEKDKDIIYLLYNICIKKDSFPQSLHI